MRRRATLYMPYIEAVIEAGGLPLLVPPAPKKLLAEYLSLADGILFTGGLDYPPKLYGQKADPKVVPLSPERAASDRRLMSLALASTKPALGICAGLQLMNIVSGGTLIQHLPTADKHQPLSGEKDSAHSVSVYAGTRLRKIFGTETIQVNSAHHQAADPAHVGKGLRISARAADGTVEGLELADSKKRFFLFVQWHPERILDASHRRKIFRAFVSAAARSS